MPTYGYIDDSGIDIGNKGYITKEYVLEWYPALAANFVTPQRWACGYNTFGQLGDNTTTDKSALVNTFGGGTNWQKVGTALLNTFAAIQSDGNLALVGNNASGQLGDGTTVNKSSPIFPNPTNSWRDVSTGYNHSVALKQNGTLWATGNNGYGQLGDDTFTERHSFTAAYFFPTTIQFRQVAAGGFHTAAIAVDGGLWECGRNIFGQLGDGTTNTRSRLYQLAANWKQVACGAHHTAAIRSAGGLWVWGRNANGQLGDGTTIDRSSPTTTVIGATVDWKYVACGDYHTAAIQSDGTLWTWGYNGTGQLGDGTTIDKSSPVTTVIGGTNWKHVSGGSSHSAAIKTDGTLWTWGNNFRGQLADGTITSTTSPISPVAGSTNWKRVECSYDATQAIAETGGL